jgi:hypothetical protein
MYKISQVKRVLDSWGPTRGGEDAMRKEALRWCIYEIENKEQPPPKEGVELVRPAVEEMFDRFLRMQCAKGEEKYGGPLMTHNGRDALMDALAELTDAYQYIVQAILERQQSARHGGSRKE